MKVITFVNQHGAWSHYFCMGYVTISKKGNRTYMNKGDNNILIYSSDDGAIGGPIHLVEKYLAAANSAE